MKLPSPSVAQEAEVRTEPPAGETRDAGSFEALAMPLFAPLYNFAHWLTQNREEAEDVVQEAYAKALKGFASFSPGTNFRAWMYRIVRNTFLSSRSGLRAAATVPLDEEENGEDKHHFYGAGYPATNPHYRGAAGRSCAVPAAEKGSV